MRVPSFRLCLSPVRAADSGAHDHDLGQIHFPVSCTPEAQKTFEHGVALLHSFWYDEAGKDILADVIRIDPGLRDGLLGHRNEPLSPRMGRRPRRPICEKGVAAIEKANSIGAKTQRERDYIAAIEVFYKDSDKVPHRERALAWRNAMQQLSAHYPEDPEAAIFYALALIATAPPPTKPIPTRNTRPRS